MRKAAHRPPGFLNERRPDRLVVQLAPSGHSQTEQAEAQQGQCRWLGNLTDPDLNVQNA